MERVLGATRAARKEESWTVVNISHYQSRFYGYAGIIRRAALSSLAQNGV